jgi:hypothetical protein
MAEISNEMYEQLRQILEKQNERTYTFEEAKEIGDGLVDFFNLLIKLESQQDGNDDRPQYLISSS